MPHLATKPWIFETNLLQILNTFAQELYHDYKGYVQLDIAVFGGSALILKHPDMRRGTVDIDTYIEAKQVVSNFNLQQYIESFAAKHSIVKDWLNQDVTASSSFSIKMKSSLIYYSTLSNCCNIYIVNDIDQLCMKAIACRKKDRKDIVALCKSLKREGIKFSDFQHNLFNHFGRDILEIDNQAIRVIKLILE